MKATLSFAVLAIIALAAPLMAAPPYDGYNPNPSYGYGTYSGGIWIQTVRIKQGANVLMQNTTGDASVPTNPVTYYGGVTAPNLSPGVTYTLEIVFGPYSSSHYAAAWIDYNNNGSFLDSGEQLGTYVGPFSASGTAVINFIPSSGAAGTCRLRVRESWSTTVHHPYNQTNYGEVEDYLVNFGLSIVTQSPLPTAAEGSAYNQTLQVANGVAPYSWTFLNGTLPSGVTGSAQGSSPWNYIIDGTPPTNPQSRGVYNFTMRVTDSAAPPKTFDKAFQITVVPPPAALPFNDDFSSFTGWTLDPNWSIGPAIAYTASSPPREEPGTDHTPSPNNDNFILGDTIGGNYTASMQGPTYARSPLFNCQGKSNVRLSFWRFYGIGLDCPNGGAKIQITNNGGSVWHDVWASSNGTTYKDPAWTSVYYNISTWAANQAVCQIRFVIGPTGSTLHTGWCIDDLKIEEPGPDLEVHVGSPTGTQLTDNQAATGPLDFGQINTSTNSAPLNLYFVNKGPFNLTLGNPTKVAAGSNPSPNDFYINSSSFLFNLPVGQSCLLTITFYRTTIGISTAAITVSHNATGSGTTPWDFNVRGEAVTPNPDIQVLVGPAPGTAITHNQAVSGARNFGSQDINAGPTAALTIIIRNSGTGQLNISTPDMGGTWWNQFIVDTTGMQSGLTAGQSTSFTIVFDPTSVGVKDAYARIAHTDTGQPSPFYVPVEGTGTTSSVPDMVVHEGSATGPSIAHNATATGGRDFGSQLVAAGATPALLITISSTGGVPLALGTPALAGLSPGEFILDTTAFTPAVASGADTSFTVAFDPTSVGPKAATIEFTHNVTGVASPFVINVQGSGVNVAPIIEVRETNAGGTQLTNPAAATGILNFGTRDVNNGPSAPAVIYVENTGTAPLTVGSPFFSPATTEFQLNSTGFAQTLAPGANATFEIIFDPTVAASPVTASVRFTHNDAGAGSPFVLNLTAIATLNAPKLEVRETSFIGTVVTHDAAPVPGANRDLGSIDVAAGNTFPYVIVIMNVGNLPMTVPVPTLGGPNSGDFSLNTSGFTTNIPAGGMTQFDVVFDPTLAGIKDCTVSFTHNDPGETSPFFVRFMGTATDPNSVLITTPDLPAGISSANYTFTMAATQGTLPYVWSVYSGNLPAGLTMAADGSITGAPSGFGSTNTVVIRVQDATGATNEKSYTVVVQRDPSSGKADSSGCAVSTAGGSAALLGLLGIGLFAARLRRREA